MIRNVNKIFSKKVKLRTSFENFRDLDKIINRNRDSLKHFKIWINDEIYAKSIYNYGIPEGIKKLINLPINDEPIYTDFIIAYSKYLTKPINYLEIGVSVGKNFFQLLNGIENSKLTGFDIEEINPILEEQLTFVKEKTIENRFESSIKKDSYLLKDFNYGSNKVKYLCADVLDDESWKCLIGQKFNLIFSDALHDPEAIIKEYEMLEKHELLDSEFIIFWDDLIGDMKNAYLHIAKRIMKKYNLNKKCFHLVKVNGWLGQNYAIKHDVGMIMNIRR